MAGKELEHDEIDLNHALELVRAGKSIFVWIGGFTKTPLAKLLGLDDGKVVDAEPYALLDRDAYPSSLRTYAKPIFVCHHGVTSHKVVKELGKLGIEGYSLAGGIEGIKGHA